MAKTVARRALLPAEMEAMRAKPHVQKWLGMVTPTSTGVDWQDAFDVLKEEWKDQAFALTLHGVTFRGTFLGLGEDPDDAYHSFFRDGEDMPVLHINCPKERVWIFLGMPIESGDLVVNNEYGWPFHIGIGQEVVDISGHIACFDMVASSKKR